MIDNKFKSILLSVQKPARYTGGEPGSIIKNKDLPEALRNKLAEISMKEDLTFNDVSYYLDGVGIDTLMEFAKDIDEIIMADGDVSSAEADAKAEFEAYLVKRMEAEKNE